MHPDPFAPRLDQAALAQVREVARDRGLRELQSALDVADADLAVAEQREDAQPRFVRQRPEHSAASSAAPFRRGTGVVQQETIGICCLTYSP